MNELRSVTSTVLQAVGASVSNVAVSFAELKLRSVISSILEAVGAGVVNVTVSLTDNSLRFSQPN